MAHRIALATTAEGSRRKIVEILRTTEGQKSFWTTDCALTDTTGRFSFLGAPDLHVTISVIEDEQVSMTVTEGFVGWVGSTWQWTLSATPDDDNVTIVQFRHFGFDESYEEDAVGFTAESWAMILERLARFVKSDVPDPFFKNEPA